MDFKKISFFLKVQISMVLYGLKLQNIIHLHILCFKVLFNNLKNSIKYHHIMLVCRI